MRVLREEAVLNRNNIWKSSFFEYLTFLSSDERGRCGEGLLTMLLRTLTSFVVEWHADKNISHEDGSIYDILVNRYRVEVKTATVGYSQKKKKQTDSYQHENIYEAQVWDKLALLDISPGGYYLTVINYTDLAPCMGSSKTKHPILGTAATKHLSAWKFDTRKNTLARGIAGGITVYIAVNGEGVISDEDQQKLKTFLNKNFDR